MLRLGSPGLGVLAELFEYAGLRSHSSMPPPRRSLGTGRLTRSVSHSRIRVEGQPGPRPASRGGEGGRVPLPCSHASDDGGLGRSGAETDKSRRERSTRHVGEGLETEPRRRWEIAYLWRGPISPDTSISFSFNFKNTARPVKLPFAWASAVAWRRGSRVRASRAARLDASPGGSLALTCVPCSAAGR